MDLEETARVLGVDRSRVRIRPTACGGGFGGKLDVSVQPLLAVAAWVTRRPVRIVYTRTESMASTTKRHPARIWAHAFRSVELVRGQRQRSTPSALTSTGILPTDCTASV